MENTLGNDREMIKKVLLALLIILILLFIMVVLYIQQPQFGSLPAGDRLEKIKKSPNYSDGQFQNLIPTTVLVNENSISAFLKFLFSKKEQQIPNAPIPGIKTDLMALDPTQDIVVWLGHSSYYLQLGGKRILIDPVFSSYASPVFL
jgi:hypothetical protein